MKRSAAEGTAIEGAPRTSETVFGTISGNGIDGAATAVVSAIIGGLFVTHRRGYVAAIVSAVLTIATSGDD